MIGPTNANGNVVTVGTAQTVTGIKTFKGNTPSEQPANGASSNSYSVSFYGGSVVNNTTYINYDNITAVNKDGQTVALWGPFQSGTTNSNGTNGFRVGLRDRGNTAWTHFLNMYSGGELSWDGYVTVTGARTYDATHTDDVVTIGSLQASTDVVHTSGNEIIAGEKTFTSTMIRGNVTNFGIKYVNPNLPANRNTFVASGSYDVATVAYMNSNGNQFCQLTEVDETSVREIRYRMFSPTLNNWAGISVTDDNTNVFARTVYRPYSSATSNDIITKGHLESAITIGGNKTFSGIVTLNRGTVQIGTEGSTADDGRIEIYGKWPYIDMHYGATGTDYTTRIWNNADGNLRFDIKDTSNNTATMNLSSSGYLQVPSPAPTTSAARNITISDQAPSGGNNGDIWIQY